MGLGNISLVQLLIVLVIVVLIFGTKRLKSIGSDLGGAIKGFRSAMNHDQDQDSHDEDEQPKDEAKPLKRQEPDAEFPEQKQQNQKNRQS